MTETIEPAIVRFAEPLNELGKAPGVRGALVATEDGLPLAMRLRGKEDAEALAVAAAILGQLGSKAATRLDRGELELLALDADGARLIIRPLSIGFLLVLAEPEANLALVSAEVTNASELLEKAASSLMRA